MFGVNQKLLDFIEQLIGTQFDEFLIGFLGIIPKIDKNKKFTLVNKKYSLTHLFITALGSKPNKTEEQVLKTQLRVAAGYVEALKVRTQTRVIQAVNAHGQEQALKKESIKPSVIRKEIVKELSAAENHVKLIVNAEGNQCRGTATALMIMRVSADNNDHDPNVFFHVVGPDERSDPETLRLHLLPDQITPRLYKISDLGTEYHKKGDKYPKLGGTNPNCRCFLSFLPRGFCYNEKGKLTWKSLDWDEYEFQKNNYPAVEQLNENNKKNPIKTSKK